MDRTWRKPERPPADHVLEELAELTDAIKALEDTRNLAAQVASTTGNPYIGEAMHNQDAAAAEVIKEAYDCLFTLRRYMKTLTAEQRSAGRQAYMNKLLTRKIYDSPEAANVQLEVLETDALLTRKWMPWERSVRDAL